MRMDGKTGRCRGGENGVMNYSSRVDDGGIGCQLTNQARERRGGRRPSCGVDRERWKELKVKKETKLQPKKTLMLHEQHRLV